MGLWWEWKTYSLPSDKTVDDVKKLVATDASWGLPSLGYTDIKIEAEAGVHGSKKGVIAEVSYLPISGQGYYEVATTCAEDNSDLNSLVGQLGILYNNRF